MSYFNDCSIYTYFYEFYRKNTKNIGWLNKQNKFNRQKANDIFLDKLWNYCTISVAQSRGVHYCEFCANNEVIFEERNGLKLMLGSAEIRVFGNDETIYAAPNLIYHYVIAHNYNPPDEFLLALFNSPSPPSSEYFDMLKKNDLEWRRTTTFEDTI